MPIPGAFYVGFASIQPHLIYADEKMIQDASQFCRMFRLSEKVTVKAKYRRLYS
jgi:hypothetical protein